MTTVTRKKSKETLEVVSAKVLATKKKKLQERADGMNVSVNLLLNEIIDRGLSEEREREERRDLIAERTLAAVSTLMDKMEEMSKRVSKVERSPAPTERSPETDRLAGLENRIASMEETLTHILELCANSEAHSKESLTAALGAQAMAEASAQTCAEVLDNVAGIHDALPEDVSGSVEALMETCSSIADSVITRDSAQKAVDALCSSGASVAESVTSLADRIDVMEKAILEVIRAATGSSSEAPAKVVSNPLDMISGMDDARRRLRPPRAGTVDPSSQNGGS